jgi:uncharacterized protein
MEENRNRIPVREGLFTIPTAPEEQARLIASVCPACGEVLFPRRDSCANCQAENLRDITLSRKGRIYSFTTVMQKPGRYYQGEVPYTIGWVEFPEKVRVQGLFAEGDSSDLVIGMDAELVIGKVGVDEAGHEIVAHKFRPVRKTREAQGEERAAQGCRMP